MWQGSGVCVVHGDHMKSAPFENEKGACLMDMVAVVDWPMAVRMTMRMRWAMRVFVSGVGPRLRGVAVQRAAARGLRLQVGRGGRLQPRLVDLDIHAVARIAGVALPQVCLRRSAFPTKHLAGFGALDLVYCLTLSTCATIQQLPGLVDLHVHAVARIPGIPLPQVCLRVLRTQTINGAAAEPWTPFRTLNETRKSCSSL